MNFLRWENNVVVKELTWKANTYPWRWNWNSSFLQPSLFPFCITLPWTLPWPVSLNRAPGTFPEPRQSLANMKKPSGFPLGHIAQFHFPALCADGYSLVTKFWPVGCQQTWHELLLPWTPHTPKTILCNYCSFFITVFWLEVTSKVTLEAACYGWQNPCQPGSLASLYMSKRETSIAYVYWLCLLFMSYKSQYYLN